MSAPLFRTAVLRLTLWYLTIIMGLSLAFSLSLYQVSSAELNRNLNRQEDLLRNDFLLDRLPGFNRFSEARLAQLQESRARIKLNLVYFNLTILASGGAVCYLLARRTLHPIEEALEAQKRFTGDASHELRTPLTAMKSEIEVALRDEKLTLAESKEIHKSTLEEISNLEHLSNGLLKLAQHDNRESLSSQLNEAQSIVNQAIQRVEEIAKLKDITISNQPTDHKIIADSWAIIEVLTVLLDNAIKYSPEKSEIIVSVEARPHAVAISVKDQGQGISKEEIPHIFDRFYRLDSSRTQSASQGYGLGLSIAKKIMDLHRGGIEVRSAPGKGSTFTLVLPSKISGFRKG